MHHIVPVRLSPHCGRSPFGTHTRLTVDTLCRAVTVGRSSAVSRGRNCAGGPASRDGTRLLLAARRCNRTGIYTIRPAASTRMSPTVDELRDDDLAVGRSYRVSLRATLKGEAIRRRLPGRAAESSRRVFGYSLEKSRGGRRPADAEQPFRNGRTRCGSGRLSTSDAASGEPLVRLSAHRGLGNSNATPLPVWDATLRDVREQAGCWTAAGRGVA